MQTFQEYKNNPISEKVVLAWLEPSQRLFNWTLHSGSVYKRTTDFFVVGVRQDATILTAVASVAAVNGAGKFFFDAETKQVYVWSIGGVSPAALWTDVSYRLFFSNAPIDLPADLSTGRQVPYDARIQKTSKFKSKFDKDQKGVALEGSGKLSLHNQDGYFEPIYDRLIWENKPVTIFSFNRELPVSERKVLFDGVITNKDFDEKVVSFDIKDFIYKLRTAIDLPLYSDTDGTLLDSVKGKPKRRVYGRVDGLSVDSIDAMKSSYGLRTIDVNDLRTSTPIVLDLTQDSNIAVASSTDVHKEVVAGDTLTIRNLKFKVKSLARIDIGLDGEQEVTVSRTSGTVARLAFAAIVTTEVTVGDHITLSVLSNASQDTKSKIIGHFSIATVNAAYLEFTLPTSIASLSDVFKTGVGEIAVTRHTNTTKITLQQASNITVSDEPTVNTPVMAYRRFNRQYLLAHHALSTKQTTIVATISSIKFSLSSVDGLYENDIVRVNGTLTTLTGVDKEAKIIQVADTILPFPSLGDPVERLGIQSVTYKEREFAPFDDYTANYTVGVGTTIALNTLAEFSAAPENILESKTIWKATSKQVLGSNNIFRDVKPRDWLKPSEEDTWYEVSEKFSDNVVILNKPYAGASDLATTSFKQPLYLADTSVVIADLYGKTANGEEDGDLIETGADVVKDLMTDAGVESRVNEPSFLEAAEASPYLMSICIPSTKGGKAPKLLDVVNLINNSVVGSLYNDLNGGIRYKVLDASRNQSDAVTLTDADILSHSVSTDSSNIQRKVLVRFGNKDADVTTEQATYSVEQATSVFVENSGIEGQVETIETVLYLRDNAQLLAQRMVFINSLSSSTVSITTKLVLADAILNDLVSLELNRLYNRLGTLGADRAKLGLISSIEKDGVNVKTTVDDLGNLFNRVGVISDNGAEEYVDAEERERRFSGYITDEDGLVEDDENTFNANLIG